MQLIPDFVNKPPKPLVSKAYMEGVAPLSPSVIDQMSETRSHLRKAVGSVVSLAASVPLGVASGSINTLANISAMPATFVLYPLAKGIDTLRIGAYKLLTGNKAGPPFYEKRNQSAQEYQQAA